MIEIEGLSLEEAKQVVEVLIACGIAEYLVDGEYDSILDKKPIDWSLWSDAVNITVVAYSDDENMLAHAKAQIEQL